MASRSTTPVQFSISTGKPVKSSNSRPNSRPATPLRRSSRGSQHGKSSAEEPFPLNVLEPAFAELSDAMATLEADMGDMQIMHDSLSRFSESFASFLYGLNMNAFCMDFTEARPPPTQVGTRLGALMTEQAPIQESFRRAAEHEETLGRSTGSAYAADQWRTDHDADATFMTTDTSFVREPARNNSPPPPSKTSARRGSNVPGTRGGRGRVSSGIARGRGKGQRYA